MSVPADRSDPRKLAEDTLTGFDPGGPVGSEEEHIALLARELLAALDREKAQIAVSAEYLEIADREFDRADTLRDALQEIAETKGWDGWKIARKALAAAEGKPGLRECCTRYVSQVGVMNPSTCPDCGQTLIVRDRKWRVAAAEGKQ